MIEINLLPGASHKSAQHSGFNIAEFTAGLTDRIKDKYLTGAVVCVVLAVSSIGTMYFYQSKQAAQLDRRSLDASRDSARFAAVLAVRASAQTTRDSVYQQLAVIRSIDNIRFTWPHLLEEIDLSLPPYTWLTSVTQTSAVSTAAGPDSSATTPAKGKPAPPKGSAKKGTDKDKASAQQVANNHAREQQREHKRAHADSLFNGTGTSTKFRIVGQTVDIQALTLFMKNLEASPFIKNVQLTRSDLVVSGGKEVTEFQLEAESETPPPSVIQTVPLSLAVR